MVGQEGEGIGAGRPRRRGYRASEGFSNPRDETLSARAAFMRAALSNKGTSSRLLTLEPSVGPKE